MQVGVLFVVDGGEAEILTTHGSMTIPASQHWHVLGAKKQAHETGQITKYDLHMGDIVTRGEGILVGKNDVWMILLIDRAYLGCWLNWWGRGGGMWERIMEKK